MHPLLQSPSIACKKLLIYNYRDATGDKQNVGNEKLIRSDGSIIDGVSYMHIE